MSHQKSIFDQEQSGSIPGPDPLAAGWGVPCILRFAWRASKARAAAANFSSLQVSKSSSLTLQLGPEIGANDWCKERSAAVAVLESKSC